MFQNIVNRVVSAIYAAVAVVANLLGLDAPPAPFWNWTVKDRLGNSKSDIDDLFKEHMQAEAIKAGQFALRVNGGLAMSTAYTWAEPGYFITQPDSVMRIASCSKAFTTAAVFDLINVRGLLTGNEKVFSFLGITQVSRRVSPHWEPADPRVFDITVRDLFKHSGGWNYDQSPMDWVFRLRRIAAMMHLGRPPTKQEFAEFIFNIRLDFDPGSDSKYSNIGYLLLGMVIEKASGKSYIDYINQRVLASLSISDVFVGKTRLSGRLDNEVHYEEPALGPDSTVPNSLWLVPLPYGGFGAMTEVMDSGGGLITSAESLSKLIFSNNVIAGDITDNPGRNDGVSRSGSMAGTASIATSFSSKDGSKKYDLALIFNQLDRGYKHSIHLHNIDTFVDALKDRVLSDF